VFGVRRQRAVAECGQCRRRSCRPQPALHAPSDQLLTQRIALRQHRPQHETLVYFYYSFNFKVKNILSDFIFIIAELVPSLLNGQCPGCTPDQHSQAMRVLTLVSQQYPQEYSQIYYTYVRSAGRQAGK